MFVCTMLVKFELLLAFSSLSSVFCLKNNENVTLMSKCILKTLQNVPHTENDVILIIPFTEMDKKIFLPIILELRRPVLISEKLLNSFSEIHPIEPSAHFIYVDSFDNFKSGFSKLNTTHQNWHPTSKWIIFFSSGTSIQENTVANVAKILKMVHVYDFEILIHENHTAVNIFTWFPFSARNKCRRYFNVTRIDNCHSLNATLRIINKIEKIPNKLPKNCVFRVCGFHWPPYTYEDPKTRRPASSRAIRSSINFVGGYHIHTIQALASRYDLRIQHVPIEEGSRWGMVLDNGTWTGALGALQSSKAEAAIGGALQTASRFSVFDCSSTFQPIFFKFYLPLPEKLPHWKSLLDIFSPSLWLFLVTVYVSTPVFIRFLSKFSPMNERSPFKSIITCFITLWPIAVGSSAHCIPKSLTVRLAFLLWLIYNFHVTLVYSSSLLSVITAPTHGQRIKTLHELSESNLKLIVVKQFLQISNMMDEELKTVIQRKYTPSSGDLSEDIKRMISKKDVVIFDPADHFEISAKEKVVQTYTLNDVIRLNNGIYLKRGSIFQPFLNDIQLAVLENGLFVKWRMDILRSYKKHLHISYENDMLPLTLQQLSGSFYLLIFGLSLSILIFTVEVIFCKREKFFTRTYQQPNEKFSKTR